MLTINSGNRNVIHFIYFSLVEIDIYFLLVFSLLGRWSFITWGEGAFCWGIIIKIFIGIGWSFSDLRDRYLGASLINLTKVVQSSNN